MKLETDAFEHDGEIPARYSCEGENLSPALRWEDLPEEAQSLALIVDDPDAPDMTWVHWVLYNLGVGETGLAEGVKIADLENGAVEGVNDFKKIGYGGPCPPKGHGTHHYFFKLYALDKKLDLPAGASKEELEAAMQHHILGYVEMIGTYERK